MHPSNELTDQCYHTPTREDQLHYISTILDHIEEVLITTDLNFIIRTWNQTAASMYGYQEPEVVGKNFNALLQFDYLTKTINSVVKELYKKGSWKGQVAQTNAQGSLRYFLYTFTILHNQKGEETGILLTGKNITETRFAPEQLKESEKFYHGLIADSLDGIIATNPEGFIKFASPSIKYILGYEPEEVIGRLTFDFVHPDDKEYTITSFKKELAENPEIKFIVVRLRKKSGEWLWCMLRGHNLLNNPDVNGLVVYFHDDTLRKEATEALKESELRFRNLIFNLQIGILLQDVTGKIILSNRAICRILDVQEKDLQDKNAWSIYPTAFGEDGSILKLEERPSYKAIKTKQPVSDMVMGIIHPKTGKPVWALINATPLLNKDGEVQTIISSFIDITERKRLEQKLLVDQLNHQRQLTQASIDSQEKERREIGKELHDNIGQQLTTIKLFLDLAKSTADETTAEMIALAVRNVSDAINEIRGLSRSLVPSTLGDLGLVESIKELVNTINRTRSLKVSFFAGLFAEIKVPENHKLMLFRIVQEQLNNIAKHAEASVVVIHLQNDGNELQLEITDDGKGFDEAKIKRGLGLTNMRNRAETLGGTFEIISEPGDGCTLRVIIPETMPGTQVF